LLQTHSEHVRIVEVVFLFTTSETFSQYGDQRPVAKQEEYPRVSFWLRAAMQTQIILSLFQDELLYCIELNYLIFSLQRDSVLDEYLTFYQFLLLATCFDLL
jgi:hypothetical protein